MVYFRVDDGFFAHPKTDAIPLESIGLWTMCGSYACRYLTDGFVPHGFVRKASGGKSELARLLVDSGLWQETLDGYLFHEWEHYQMSKEDVEIRREGDRDRQSRLRMSRRDSSVTPSGLQKESGRGGEGSGEVVISFNKEEKFDEFWAAFPAKKDKAAAKKSWAKLQPLDHDAAIAGASAYSSWLSQHPDPPSVKYPQGWLTGRRWEDELKPVRSKASSERMNEFQRQMQAAKKIDETRLELEE